MVTGRCNFLRRVGAVRQGRDKSGDISHIVTAIWPHADLHEKSETELKAKIQLIWPKIRAQKMWQTFNIGRTIGGLTVGRQPISVDHIPWFLSLTKGLHRWRQHSVSTDMWYVFCCLGDAFNCFQLVKILRGTTQRDGRLGLDCKKEWKERLGEEGS